jgi:hypothetical protein
LKKNNPGVKGGQGGELTPTFGSTPAHQLQEFEKKTTLAVKGGQGGELTPTLGSW